MKKKLVSLFLFLTVFAAGIGVGFLGKQKKTSLSPKVPQDKYIAFIDEVYNTIKENYWEEINDEQLTSLFLLGIEKLVGQPQSLDPKNKTELEKLLGSINKQIKEEEKKKEFVVQLADIVLANLKPFGRSRLYTLKDEKALSQNVRNVTETNHYEVLGVRKEASTEEIEKAYEEKVNQAEPNSEEGKKIARAFEVLKEEDNRKLYDESGIEPTISYKLVRPTIFYIHIKKFSPTTFDELQRVTAKVDHIDGLDTLILDLRNNIGGAIDGLPYFLGPFIGQDQYAYQFYHQGKATDFKTKTGWMPTLVRYKKVVVLINEGTQSSAEVMAAVIKKYNVGVTVGTTTKGWGTVEKVFSMENEVDPNEKHSIFLVHSLTLRDDNQPIEGRGIEPLVNINDPGWEKQLYSYFNYQDLVEAVKEVLKTS